MGRDREMENGLLGSRLVDGDWSDIGPEFQSGARTAYWMQITGTQIQKPRHFSDKWSV